MKGDQTNCCNCGSTSLLPTTYTILSNILLSRLIPYAEEIIGGHQRGFRSNRSTTDHVFCIRQIIEKKIGKQRSSESALYTSRKLLSQLGGRSCIIFLLSLVSP